MLNIFWIGTTCSLRLEQPSYLKIFDPMAWKDWTIELDDCVSNEFLSYLLLTTCFPFPSPEKILATPLILASYLREQRRLKVNRKSKYLIDNFAFGNLWRDFEKILEILQTDYAEEVRPNYYGIILIILENFWKQCRKMLGWRRNILKDLGEILIALQ